MNEHQIDEISAEHHTHLKGLQGFGIGSAKPNRRKCAAKVFGCTFMSFLALFILCMNQISKNRGRLVFHFAFNSFGSLHIFALTFHISLSTLGHFEPKLINSFKICCKLFLLL